MLPIIITVIQLFSANLPKEENEIQLSLQTSNVFLNERLKINICNFMHNKMAVRNNLLYLQIADIFNLSFLLQASMTYTERCFLMVAETNNFSHLDFALVKTILQSSKLHITSELEVFYAANEWISYNTKERSKFAKHLLLAVRLPILSEPALKSLMCGPYPICKSKDCKKVVENLLNKNKKFLHKLHKNSFETRYCDQNLFNILAFDCSKGSGSLVRINCNDVKKARPAFSKLLISIKQHIADGFCLKGKIYILLRINKKEMMLKKYSNKSNAWKSIVCFKYRDGFCASVLVNNIYIIGGLSNSLAILGSCIQHSIENNETKKGARMNRKRYLAASTTFQGKIVVSGGMLDDDFEYTNTVEVYDHIANKWQYMASMIRGKSGHSIIAIKSKLYVFKSLIEDYEVFDKVTNRFTSINTPIRSKICFVDRRTISIGSKIVFFGKEFSKVVVYDTEMEKWYEEKCDCLKDCRYSSVIKFPQI